MEDIRKSAALIETFEDYREVFVRLGETAVGENRLRNSAFYFCSAEFLTSPSHPDKIPLYDKFIALFYEGFKEDKIECHKVAYKNGFLPAMRLAPVNRTRTGTVIIHGGFDSLIEEFYCFWAYFAHAGYEVIAFDGPSQGGTLRKY